MANKLYEESKVQAIANAIRGKTGGTESMTISEMADKISLIQSDGGATEPYVEETYNNSGALIEAVMHGHTSVRRGAFYSSLSLQKVVLPSKVTVFNVDCFSACPKLCLDALPSSLEGIYYGVFNGCTSLNISKIPAGVTYIGGKAFQDCTGLTEITFKGTPSTIGTDIFNGCSNLTTINVPWSEGAVANAPWGATNATINYDYTEES